MIVLSEKRRRKRKSKMSIRINDNNGPFLLRRSPREIQEFFQLINQYSRLLDEQPHLERINLTIGMLADRIQLLMHSQGIQEGN